jgi:hypothetical protein
MINKGYYIAQGFIVMVLVLISMSAAGCDVIGGIFKAGVWTGLILVVVLVGGAVMVARMFKH